MSMSPSVMSSRPTIIRSRVDFPHPDGPTRIRNSPSSMSMLTSFTAGKPSAYFLTMFFIWMAAISCLLLVGRGVQPLTAPLVSPATIFCWKSSTRITTGIVTITDAAAMGAVGWENWLAPREERQRGRAPVWPPR